MHLKTNYAQKSREVLAQIETIINQSGESKELQALQRTFAQRHSRIYLGIKNFLIEFEKAIPADITFEELLLVSFFRTGTGHPTEFLSGEGINILEQYQNAIEHGIDAGDSTEEMRRVLGKLAKELKIIPKKKDAAQEGKDGLHGAEKLCNALRFTAEQIYKVALKKGIITRDENGNIRAEDLRKCKNFIKVMSWSLDSDGKPGANYLQALEAIRQNKEAILRRYIIGLADTVSRLEPSSEEYQFARSMVVRLISTMPNGDENKKQNSVKKLWRHIDKIHLREQVEKVVTDAIQHTSHELAYKNSDEIIEDLYRLKNFESKTKKFPVKKGEALSMLDGLILEPQSFHGQAQKIEYRQNVKIFRLVAKRVRESSAGEIDDVMERLKAGEAVDYRRIGAMLNGITKEEKAHYKYLKESRWEGLTPEQKRELVRLEDAANGVKATAQEEADFYLVDTLMKMEIIASEPDAFERILMAECGKTDGKSVDLGAKQSISDFKDTRFLYEMAIKKLTSEDARGKARAKIAVTPLFEYNKQISELPVYVEEFLKDPEARKYAQEHGMTIMIAGSDLTKTAGSSVVHITQESVAAVKAIGRANGIDITIYWGTGSALSRNNVPLTDTDEKIHFRTSQGIENRRPVADVACEFLRNIMNRFKMKSRNYEQRDFASLFPDIGNSAGVVDSNAHNSGLRHVAKKRFDRFNQNYNNEPFNILVEECLPALIDKLFSFGDRPNMRVGGSADRGPAALRAIGYGQQFNNAGWGAPQLFAEFADINASEDDLVRNDGFIAAENLAGLKKEYLEKASVRDIFSRGVHSIALSDTDIGWNYLGARYGLEIKVARNYEDIARINVNGKDFSLAKCLQGRGELAKLFTHVKTQGFTDKQMNKVVQAFYSALWLELENQKALRMAYQFISYAGCKEPVGKRPVSQEDLIELIGRVNPSYGAELAESKVNVDVSRETLLEIFKLQAAEKDIPDELMARGYAAYGVLRNTFEMPPVSMLYIARDRADLALAA